MTNYFTIFSVTFIIVVVFTMINIVGDDINTNPNLDTQSQELIDNINTKVSEDFDEEEFEESTTLNGSFEGQDAFSREFFESKSSSETKTGIIERILKTPDLIFMSTGIPEEWVTEIKVLIGIFLQILISFATFNAFFNKKVSKR